MLDLAPPGARLVFSSGWQISRDSQDIYSWRLKWKVHVLGGLGKLAWAVDLDDQVEACRRVFASDTRWTVVRGSELNGTASFLAAGSAIYQVRGYQRSCRLAAYLHGRLQVYLAQTTVHHHSAPVPCALH